MHFNFLSPVSAAKFYYREFAWSLHQASRVDAISRRSLSRLKGSKTNKSAIVFGNGPSLKLISPDKINNLLSSGVYDFFCVNRFVFSDFFDQLSPGYGIFLVLSDEASFSSKSIQDFQFISNCVHSGKISTLFVPSWVKKKAVTGSSSLVLAELKMLDLNNQVKFFNDSQGSVVFSRNICPTKPRSYISMTVYKALAIAGYMSYQNIFVCGIDNTYAGYLATDGLNRVYRSDIHFDSEAYGYDSRRDYFWADQGVDMAGALMEAATLFADLREKFSHLPIINLDSRSLTDAFVKKSALDVYI